MVRGDGEGQYFSKKGRKRSSPLSHFPSSPPPTFRLIGGRRRRRRKVDDSAILGWRRPEKKNQKEAYHSTLGIAELYIILIMPDPYLSMVTLRSSILVGFTYIENVNVVIMWTLLSYSGKGVFNYCSSILEFTKCSVKKKNQKETSNICFLPTWGTYSYVHIS